MKQWIIGHFMLLIIVIVAGQIGKMGFVDSGVMTMKSIEDAIALNSGIDYVFSDEDYHYFVDYEEDYTEILDRASIIVVGTPTGRIHQYHFNLAQEIKVERVIKGDPNIEEDTSTFIYGEYGFSINNDLHNSLTYYSVKNLMQPGQQYLLFMQPLELNDYQKNDSYRLIDSVFNYINLTSNSTTMVTVPLEKLKFSDLYGIELITDSERVLKLYSKIKQQIIDKYLSSSVTGP